MGQRNRALLLAAGIGVEEDQALAVLNLHFAAVGGDQLAQLALGYRHMYGINVPKNCQAAVEYYKPAVDVVVHDAQQFSSCSQAAGGGFPGMPGGMGGMGGMGREP